MTKRQEKITYVIIILMGIITIISLTFAGILGSLYLREKRQVQEVINAQDTEEREEIILEQEDLLTQQKVNEMLVQKEASVQESMKAKMKELVMAKDGGPLTMLRYFFPENLIFYDEGGYEFIPIINSIKKHTLMAENFKKSEDGEITYEQGDTVLSYKGIDVSKYQETIDWQAVKADGVEYAFIRLGLRGYGSGKIVLDEYYDENMRGANEAGVSAGVYFFTQAITVEEAIEEAQFVVENLQEYDVTCPVVFDVEMITGNDGRANSITKEERTDIVIAFCEEIKRAGYTPMIYGNVKCFTKMLDITKIEAYEKWYAFYDDYMYFPYEVSIWQYTEKGTVDGIKGDVDLNISFKLW